jgi:hypothetical protein
LLDDSRIWKIYTAFMFDIVIWLNYYFIFVIVICCWLNIYLIIFIPSKRLKCPCNAWLPTLCIGRDWNENRSTMNYILVVKLIIILNKAGHRILYRVSQKKLTPLLFIWISNVSVFFYSPCIYRIMGGKAQNEASMHTIQNSSRVFLGKEIIFVF